MRASSSCGKSSGACRSRELICTCPNTQRRALQRILFDCSFAVSAFIGSLLGKSPELVIVISPPLQLSITAFLIRKLTRARVFLEIQDLVPDAAIAVGALREGSRAVRIAQALERFAYRTAESIGVICDGMRSNLISKSVPEQKVSLLPNYIDMSFMQPVSGQNGFRQVHWHRPGTVSSDVFGQYRRQAGPGNVR
jgi:colanic acid biosynthesis glycosyl transferase WcaI